MKLQNVVISAAFTVLLYLVYTSRYVLDAGMFAILLFGLLIAGAIFVWQEVIRKGQIKHDERTELLASRAARITLVGAFALIIAVMAYLTVTERPTSPIGVLALLVGLLSLIYSVTYAYLEKTQ